MPGFLKIDSVEGECDVAGYEKWILVRSIDQRCTSRKRERVKVKNDDGSSRYQAKFSGGPGELTVVIEIDRSLPELLYCAAELKEPDDGEPKNKFGKVEVELCTSPEMNEGPEPYLRIELKGVRIESATLDIDCGYDAFTPPTLNLTFKYQEINWQYMILDAHNDCIGTVTTGWSEEKGVIAGSG